MSSPKEENSELPSINSVKRFGPFSCRTKIYYSSLLVLINIVLFADQNLLAPVLTPIAREFEFVDRYENGTIIMEYDEKLRKMVRKVNVVQRDNKLAGDITLAFFLIGGSVSLIVGYLTDVVNRRNTLAVVVLLGETSCLLTYYTTDYSTLFLTRALTGIALGGAVPLMYSLFGDLFTVEERGTPVALAGLAMGVGMAVGQILAGPVAGPDGSNWRLSFVIVAVPAYFLVVILLLTVKEPPRATTEKALQNFDSDLVYSEKLTWSKILALFRTKTIVLIFIQGLPGCIPWGMMFGFFTDFLIEEKKVDRAISGGVALFFGVGAAIGQLIGGYLTDKLNTKMRFIPLLMGSTTMFGVLPVYIFINIPPQPWWVYAMMFLPTGAIVGITGSAVKVLLMNVALPETRGCAFSIFNLFDDIGKGFGSFAVAKIIAIAGNRTTGMNYALGGWIVCGIILLCMYFTVENDYETSQVALTTINYQFPKNNIAPIEMATNSISQRDHSSQRKKDVEAESLF